MGAGGLQGFAAGVSESDAAGAGAGSQAHPDVHGHIAHHQGFLRGKAQFAEGLQDRFGVGLGLRHVVGPEDIAEIGRQTHFAQKGIEGAGMPGRGHGETAAFFLQNGQRFLHMRENGRDNPGAELVKNLPVHPGPFREDFPRKVGEHGEDARFQGQADGADDGFLACHRIMQPTHGLLVGADDEFLRIGQRAVEIEDDEFDHRTEELISKDTLFSGEMYAFLANWATFAA